MEMSIGYLIWMAGMTIMAIDIQWSVRRLEKMLGDHPKKRKDARDVGGKGDEVPNAH